MERVQCRSVRLRAVTLSVKVLGPVAVERSGAAVALGGAKQALLLGALVARRRGALTSDQLCDVLWGDAPPASAATTAQSHLSRLRRILEPEASIDAYASSYVLVAPPETFDADRFERAIVDSSDTTDPTVVKDCLGEALSWWRGPAFGDLAEHEWIRPEAVRLDEIRLSATERWVDARLTVGDDVELVGDLERLVALHPLREIFWRQLVLALYRSGRQAEALRRSADLARLMREELGLDPSPAARELEWRILSNDPALRSTAPGIQLSEPRVVDWPTRLIGRDDDIARVAKLMTTQRVVTLVGPGGVGKTRLARRHAADHGAAGRAATMVELAVVREAASVAAAVATALDVQQRQHGTVEETLTEVLRERDQLVVLDNCEHVIGAVARLVGKLAMTCPSVRVLATSREPLGVPGEVVYTVAPLAVADDIESTDLATSPAVQLFCDRAVAARPDFFATPDIVRVVARLCRRLDGLPLAIELAAVRARSLGLDAMIERIDSRFSLLDAGPRHVDHRHQNLQNMVAWSYDLLAPVEQRLFMRLSTFAGTFDLHAVDAVCAVDDDSSDVLFTLVDRSMVQVADRDEPRYHLLETLREFGRSRLDEAGQSTRFGGRHLDWFLELAERAREGMNGPDERACSDSFEHDFDNFRAAHLFAMQNGNVGAALRLVAAMHEFSFRKIRYEVTSWAAEAVQINGAVSDDRFPEALATVAYGHFVRGELDAAISVALAAVDAATRLDVDDGGLAERALGNAYFYLGRTDEALAWMDRMVNSARRAGSPARLAHALYMRSVAETSVGRSVRGAIMAGEAQAAAQTCESPTALAQAGYALGLALESTEPVAGRDRLAAAAAHAAAAGNRWVEAFARTEVLWIEARLGHTDAALRGYESVIDTWYRGGDWANQWLSIRHVFGILQQMGDLEAAAVVHGGLSAAGVNYALPFEPADAARLQASVDVLRDKLGDGPFAAAVERGAAMPDHALVTFVLERIRDGGRLRP